MLSSTLGVRPFYALFLLWFAIPPNFVPRCLAADEERPLVAQDQGKITTAGQALEDRILARSLIDYGVRSRIPEAVVTGVTMLVRHSVHPAQSDDESAESLARETQEELGEFLKLAAEMRPGDAVLNELILRAQESVEQQSRGLVGGPQSWTVTIPEGDYFELDPSLAYNAQEKATVHAYCQTPATLGIRVRRSDQRRYVTQSVGRQRVTANWNAGIYTTGWIVRIYNLSGPDKLRVVIETN